MQELRADVGIALDGDADRVVIVTERGEVVDGDALLALCARDLLERGKLRGGGVVATVMSNLGLERALAELGLELVRTQVGDRYVVEEMRRSGYNLGGEQSGHLVFLDHNTTGDGLLTALQVLAIMRRKERPLSELVRGIERFPAGAAEHRRRGEAAARRPARDGAPHPSGRGRARGPRARADPLLRHRAQGARHGGGRRRGARARVRRRSGGDLAARARPEA